MHLRKSLLAAILVLALLAPQIRLAMNGDAPVIGESLLAEIIPFAVQRAHAQGPADAGERSAAQKFFTGVLNVFLVLNWIALSADQALLNPDVIFGEKNAAGVRPMELILRNIWVTSRDIVNGIFAFILLAAGIYLIVKSDSDAMGKVKSGAKNFVLAVILVNFSWFFPRVILDMANVLTSVVYQLPSLVNPLLPCDGGVKDSSGNPTCLYVWRVHLFPTMGDCDPDTLPPGSLPAECERPVDESGGSFLGLPNYGKSYWDFIDVFYTDWKDVAKYGNYIDFSKIPSVTVPVSGADIILNGLAVNFAKIPNFNLIDFADMQTTVQNADSIKKVMTAYFKFFVELIMHTILSIAVGLALLAFLVVLIIRIAVLWITIAFMPFVFIGFALRGPGGMGELSAGEAQAPNIWKNFIKYAFLPALVAIPFAIGFTLLSQLYYVKTMTINLNIDGLETIFPKGIDNFHELLWMIITIGIIWFGTFMILETDKVAGGIVRGIRGVGTTAAKTAGTVALAAPLGPIPRVWDEFKQLGGAARRGQLGPQMKRFGDVIKGREPTTEPVPPTREKIETVVREHREVVREGMGGISRATTDAALTSAINDLRDRLVRSGSLTESQANAMLGSREGIRHLVEAAKTEDLITDAEKKTIATKLERRFAAGAGAAAKTPHLHLSVDDLKEKDTDTIIEEIKGLGAVRGDTALDELREAERMLRDKGETVKAGEIGQLHTELQDIKSAIAAKSSTNIDDIRDELDPDLRAKRDDYIKKLIELM